MNARILALFAATSFVAANAVQAAAVDRDVGAYLSGAHAAAARRAATHAPDLKHGLVVKGHVDADGRIYDAHVVRSSGSLADDVTVTRALRRLKTPEPPVRLIGAAVTLTVAPPTVRRAAND